MSATMPLCACGCGSPVTKPKNQILKGHQGRLRPFEERFWEKVDERGPGECWPWMGAINSSGYGTLRRDSRTLSAHRVSYEMKAGPIPAGLHIDHLCRNRACVNPAHMEPVTQGENTLRGEGACARNARKTHCIHGHEYTPENTYWRPNGGGRTCLICRQRSNTAAQKRRKAK